jgi:folate-binding protein YgfZ
MPEVESKLYTLITVSGTERTDFLQGQLTQDVRQLPAAERLLAAWCTPKGRVIAVIRLLDLGDKIGMLVPASLSEQILKRLMMYRLRADVQFEVSDNWRELATIDDTDPERLIRAGIPTVDASNTELFTPHMLNLDKLGAISFAKGCYTGQEIVARTEHLGASKRRLMRYEADAAGIAVGAKLSDGERNVGDVVNVAGRQLLAVTPVELHRKTLLAGHMPIEPRELPYRI